jgi:homoserine O-acetyltransferase
MRLGSILFVLFFAPIIALAADFPAPQEGSWVARDFKFHTGEVLPDLRMHYRTVGAPTGQPVLVLHGTTQSGAAMLAPTFGGELFGDGQALDAKRYYIILPDSVGHGNSSKPSDGMRAKFPRYNYDDMVDAQHRLLTEHLGVKRLRLVIGNSMGGMQAWIWAQKYPDFMDVVVPMASLPTEMAGRNWMMRRLIVDSIRSDPEWMGGNYTKQPRSAQFASVFYGIGTNGGNTRFQRGAHAREGRRAARRALKAPFPATRTTCCTSGIRRATTTRRRPGAHPGELLAINSADDERNPPELGVLDREIKRVKNGRVLLIPQRQDDRPRHDSRAQFWKKELEELLRQ